MAIVEELRAILSVLFQEQLPLHLEPRSTFTSEQVGLQEVTANKMPEGEQEAKTRLLATTEVQVETLDLRAVPVEVEVEELPQLSILVDTGL